MPSLKLPTEERAGGTIELITRDLRVWNWHGGGEVSRANTGRAGAGAGRPTTVEAEAEAEAEAKSGAEGERAG